MTTSTAFDGTIVKTRLNVLECGGVPHFDQSSGHSYRCDTCFAVIGSVAQPDQCREMNK